MTDHEFFLERFSVIYPYSHCTWRISEAAGQASFGSMKGPMLDLGCGDGTYLSVMLERIGMPVDPETGDASPVHGLDPQAHEIEKARKTGIYHELFISTSSAIPLPDASVRTVFSNSVVEHIPDKTGTIREVARVLLPGGRYLFSVPSPDFFAHFPFRGWLERRLGSRAAQAWTDLINWKFKHVTLQSSEAWRRDLASAGLDLIDVRYTLTPDNAATWERYLLPSYLQHVPAKMFGWVPFSARSRSALRKRLAALTEPSDLAVGGNMILLAEKKAV